MWLLPEATLWIICWRIKANTEGPALEYVFRKVKREGVIPSSYKGPLCLQGGQLGVGKRTQRCSSSGRALTLSPFVEKISHRVGEGLGTWEAAQVKGVPWAKQWGAQGLWWYPPYALLGPSSTLFSLKPTHQLTIPDDTPCELPSLSVSQQCGPRPAIAVETDAARHPAWCWMPFLPSHPHHTTHWDSSWSMVRTYWQNTIGLDQASTYTWLTVSHIPQGTFSLLSIKESHVCPAHTNVCVTAKLGHVVLWLGILH